MNNNVNGTITLFFAGFISKVLGAIYRIPLSNYLGTEGMGLYQMAFPIYSFLLTIITGGISVILSQKIAKARAINNIKIINKEYKIAKNISTLLAFVFLFFLLIFAYPMAYIQGNIMAFWGYLAISVGFVFACKLGAYRGYYQGFGNMLPTAVSQIIEQTFKLVLGLAFASFFVKYGIVYGVFGAILGVSFSEIISFIYFKLINKKIQKSKQKVKIENYISFFKQVVPVGASYGVLPLSSLIDSFLIVNLLQLGGFETSLSTSLYGIETGMILPIINIPNILISAIAITLLPQITYINEQKQNLSESIQGIFKTVIIFILPCCVGLFLLAKPFLSLIYPNLTTEFLNVAVNLLKFSVFEMFFLCFVTITNAILQALSKNKTPLKSLIIGIIVKIVLVFILVPNSAINVYGLVVASTIGYFVSATINVISIKKLSKFKISFIQIAFPVIACVIMSIVILCFNLITKGQIGFIGFFTIIIICVAIYFATLFMFGILNIKEIKKLLQNTAK